MKVTCIYKMADGQPLKISTYSKIWLRFGANLNAVEKSLRNTFSYHYTSTLPVTPYHQESKEKT